MDTAPSFLLLPVRPGPPRPPNTDAAACPARGPAALPQSPGTQTTSSSNWVGHRQGRCGTARASHRPGRGAGSGRGAARHPWSRQLQARPGPCAGTSGRGCGGPGSRAGTGLVCAAAPPLCSSATSQLGRAECLADARRLVTLPTHFISGGSTKRSYKRGRWGMGAGNHRPVNVGGGGGSRGMEPNDPGRRPVTRKPSGTEATSPWS